MKKRTSADKIIAGQETREALFGVDSRNLAHIFDILRNQLYSDQIMACIREYSTNAHDAQIESGFNGPFEVTLPTNANPVFIVRDFGTGLSPEDVMEIYCQYGSSTKRMSNAYNGMLGLGSKSAFSYCKSFTITSIFEGTKYIFNAFLDESLIGKMSLMHEEATEAPSGVEIKIPVKPQDIYEFNTKAARIYKYFKTPPTLHNFTGSIQKDKTEMQGEGWRMTSSDRYSRKPSFAIMGNVAYPINAANVKTPAGKSLVECGLEIEFEIGELEIAASREALQYTPITERALNERIDAIVETIVTELSKGLEEEENIWDACLKLKQIMQISSVSGDIKRRVQSVIKWNEIELGPFNDGFRTNPGVYAKMYTKASAYNSRKRCDAVNILYPNKDYIIVENDEQCRALSPRIATLFDTTLDNGNKIAGVYVIDFKGVEEGLTPIKPEDARKTWFDNNHWEGVPMIKMSDIPKPVRVKSTTKRAVNMSEAYKLGPYNASTVDGYWDKSTVDLSTAKGLYVEIYRNKIVNEWTSEPYSMWKMVETLTALGATIPTIYGVKSAVLTNKKNKIGPKMKPLGKFLEEQVKALVEKMDLETPIRNRTIYDQCASRAERYGTLANKVPAGNAINKMYIDFLAVKTNAQSSKQKDIDELTRVAKTLRIPMEDFSKKQYKNHVIEELDFIEERYPMLALANLNGAYRYVNLTNEDWKMLVDYINLVDAYLADKS